MENVTTWIKKNNQMEILELRNTVTEVQGQQIVLTTVVSWLKTDQ